MNEAREEILDRLYSTLEILNGKLLEVEKPNDICLITDAIDEIFCMIKSLFIEKGE